MPSHYRIGTESVEVTARRHFYAAAPEHFGCQLTDLAGTPATLLSAKALPSPTMNRVIGLPGDMALPDDTLARIRQFFRARDITQFWLHAWNIPEHAALHASLLAHGCEARGSWAELAYPLDGAALPAPATGAALPAVRLARQDEYSVAGEILSLSFGMPVLVEWMAGLAGRPAWQVYFVEDERGKPVATGTLLIDGANAWFGMGATLPEARQRGAQQALLAARLAAARAAGCSMVSVEAEAADAGEHRPSLKNLLRAGFLLAGTRRNYLCNS